MVLPILFFAALGGAVWGICMSLWNLADPDDASGLTKTLETRLGSNAAPEPQPESQPEPQAEEPEEEAGHGWRLRGVVYDLTTLKPLPGCELTFSSAHDREKSTTDSRGRYRITLPPLAGRGYQVTIAKSGYSTNYLNPATEGVAEMAVDSRAELARDLVETKAEPASLQPYGNKPFVTDFHLAPIR